MPLFFAVSGFFFARRPAPVKTLRRIGTLYLGWSAAYLVLQLPQWHASGWWGPHVLVDYLLGLVTKGSYYHLWYLLATLYAVPLLAILVKRDSPRLMLGVCCICWAVECLTYSYSWIGPDRIPVLTALLDRFSGVCDGVFRALPLMLVGVFCHRNAASRSAVFWGKRALVAFLCLTAEASVLYFATPNPGLYSYLISTPFFTYYALSFLLRVEFRFRSAQWAVILRRSSLMIYCVHPFFDYLIEHTPVAPGVPAWLVVTILSTGFSGVCSVLLLRRGQTRTAA